MVIFTFPILPLNCAKAAFITEEFMTEMVKCIKHWGAEPEQIDLLFFNPEVHDAQNRIKQVEEIKTEFMWSDH